MAEMIKVACVGSPDLHNFLSEEIPEWDWQIPVETMDEFEQHLHEDNGGIDINTRAIFIYDGFFDPSAEDTQFEEFVAQYAPFAMLAILNYDPSQNSIIQKAVSDVADINKWDQEKIHFIDFQSPLRSIDDAVQATIREHNSSEVAEAFSSGKPAVSLMEFEEEDDTPKDDGYAGPVSVVANDEKLGKVVSFTSSKGGSGKSTVAVSLASYIARASMQSKKEGLEGKNLSVCIVDLDVRDGQLGFVTGKTQPTVLKTALREEISPETVKEASIWNEGLGCDLYLAPKSGRTAIEETPPQFYNELIQTLRSMYDYIILDTSVNYLDPLLEEVAYPSSDQIIFITDLGVSSVYGMSRWIKEVTGKGPSFDDDTRENKISESKIGIVVNKTMPGVNMNPEKVKAAALGRPVLSNLPSMPTMVTAAANSRRLQDLTTNKEFNQYTRILARTIIGKSYKLAHIDT